MSSTQREWLYRLTLVILLGCFALWSVLHLGQLLRGTDEGLNLMRARMVREGYLLYQDIWSDQPPLLPLCLVLAFDLFGESVSVARSVIAAFACLSLLSTAWIARQLGGRIGSLVAVIFLAFNPLFVKLSRSVMVGLPANALAALAMACGLMALRTKREAWLAAAGVSLSASVLTKPIQPFVLVPLIMIVWWWGKTSEGTLWHRWGRKLLLLSCAAIVPLLVAILFGGPHLLEQVIGTYLQGQASGPYRFSLVISDTVAYLRDGGLLYWTGLLLALHGVILAWRQRDREGIAVSIWLLSALVAVLSQAHFRRRYLLLPAFPAAGLLSMGLRNVGHGARLAWRRPRRYIPLAARVVAIFCLAAGTAVEVRSALVETCCERYPAAEEAVAMLRSMIPPGGYVISDHGTLTFRAGLLTPPELAVPSLRRIQTGQLSADSLIAVTRDYEPEAIMLWSGRLISVTEYVDWVEQYYCLARAWRENKHTYYVPCDTVPPCEGCPAQLGDFARIAGWSLSTPTENNRMVTPGDSLLLTVHWQALKPTGADYHVFCHLGTDTLVAQRDGRPQRGKYSTYRWLQGEGVIDSCSLEVPANAPPGYYPLWVGMYDWATKERLPVMDAQGHHLGSAALLTHVRVGRPEFEAPPISQPQEAVLGDQVRLLGYDLRSEETEAGGVVGLTLYWQCVEEVDTSYTVFVHIVDSKGKIVGQWDSIPQGGGLPTTTWVSGEVVADAYEVPVIPEAGPGSYSLAVGMYDGGTGERLAARGGDDVRLPEDRVFLGEIQLSR